MKFFRLCGDIVAKAIVICFTRNDAKSLFTGPYIFPMFMSFEKFNIIFTMMIGDCGELNKS